jgi:hypothetical protein
MWFRSRFNGLSARPSQPPDRLSERAAKGPQRPRSIRPRLETLEDRSLLSTYLVNSRTDTGAGSGLAGDLRYCVAHATSGTDTITFGVTGTIQLQSALPDLNTSVAIQDLRADLLTVERNPTSNASFGIFVIGSAATVQVSGLTLAHGNAAAGGAIKNFGTLSVGNCTLALNQANYGGAIYNAGTLAIDNSTIYSNTAVHAIEDSNATNDDGYGGGICNASGLLTVSNSTISANTALGITCYYLGDGPYPYPYGTNGFGGGVYVAGGMASIHHSTLAGNDAIRGLGDGSSTAGISRGGGIFNATEPGALRVSDTILADNTADYAVDLSGRLTSLGHNLVRNAAGSIGFGAGDLVNIDPRLGPLQDNGGPTKTMALLADSPALNAGSNSAGLATDQRGLPRVADPAADIGAYESQPLRLTAVRVNDGSPQRSMVTSVTVTFNTVVALPLNPATAFSLTGPSGAIAVTVDLLQSTGTTTVARLKFAGPGVVAGSLPDGRYTLRVLATQVTDSFGQRLDGDGDSQPGGDYVSPGTVGLFRLFGDSDGNGVVDARDLFCFRQAFGSAAPDPAFPAYFDFDGSGAVDVPDLLRFRQAFGNALP